MQLISEGKKNNLYASFYSEDLMISVKRKLRKAARLDTEQETLRYCAFVSLLFMRKALFHVLTYPTAHVISGNGMFQ